MEDPIRLLAGERPFAQRRVQRSQLGLRGADARDNLLLGGCEGHQAHQLLAPAFAQPEALFDHLPWGIAEHLLHARERPGPLHVAKVGPIFILRILNVDQLLGRGRLDDNGIERRHPGQYGRRPATMASRDQILRGGISVACPGKYDNRLDLPFLEGAPERQQLVDKLLVGLVGCAIGAQILGQRQKTRLTQLFSQLGRDLLDQDRLLGQGLDNEIFRLDRRDTTSALTCRSCAQFEPKPARRAHR